MIRAADFLAPAKSAGFDFWAGVPCSFLTPLINHVIDDDGLVWVSSANEGDAVATAAGASLAGRRGAAIMQNSGLGNAVSPLTSLNAVFRIPVLVVVTLRGEPGLGDEPQHALMGRITTDLLDLMGIAWNWFPAEVEAIEPALKRAARHMDTTGLPYALVMRKGSVAPQPLAATPPAVRSPGRAAEPAVANEACTRSEALHALVEATPPEDSVLIASTGYTGRELFAIDDRPNQLYMVGSMGCASSLALGLALARPGLRVVVADGDGAALMRLGNLAAVGAYAGDNYYHVVLDNGMHESTGRQATLSHAVRFAPAALACGYARSAETGCAGIAGFLAAGPGPALAHVRTLPGVPEGLPRPDVTPPQVRARLMRHIGAESAWATV